MREQNFFIAGRGAGKTAVAVKKAEICAHMSPGTVICITEQTSREIDDILIPTWKALIDPRTYTLKGSGSDTNIAMCNGTTVTFRSRKATRQSDDPPFRGPNIGRFIHDELALDKRQDVIEISQMCLRHRREKYLGIDVITTPKPNWLYGHVRSLGIANPVVNPEDRKQVSDCGKYAAIYGRTQDNPHNRDLHERMFKTLDESTARQELLGEWVAREGKVWNFVEKDWPHGNMLDVGYNKNQPFILGVDLGGANGAYQLYQFVNAQGYGQAMKVLCLMAEWTPQGIDPWVVVDKIKQFTSKGICKSPIGIKVGHDVNSPGTTGDIGEFLFSKLGWGNNIEPITGWVARKSVQHHQAAFLICNTAGIRQFCISKKLKSFYKGKTRGLMDCMRHDTYPDAKSKDYFRKEKTKSIFTEDSRDAFLYTAVGVYRPTFKPQERWAG